MMAIRRTERGRVMSSWPRGGNQFRDLPCRRSKMSAVKRVPARQAFGTRSGVIGNSEPSLLSDARFGPHPVDHVLLNPGDRIR